LVTLNHLTVNHAAVNHRHVITWTVIGLQFCRW